MPIIEKIDSAIYKERRIALKKLIIEKHQNASKGLILLLAGFEQDSHPFKQESTFYYFTGNEQPASALIIDMQNDITTLFIPNFGKERKKWIADALDHSDDATAYGVDVIDYAGEPCKGYQCHPFFSQEQYANIIAVLQKNIKEQISIFTLNPSNSNAYIEQRFMLQRLNSMIEGFSEQLIDISAIVAKMRRKKTHQEIELMYKAVATTMEAHDAVAPMIAAGKNEYEMQALIEYVITSFGASIAFPSIVASGKNSIILHYMNNNQSMKKGDLVVIDIGARYNYYCADLTRTYPISGMFNKRQKEVYDIVLDTQAYIADLARPGYFLLNAAQKDKSLHHCAVAFLEERGYAQYFTHGLGHFLGIDVHDIGDYTEPLQEGDIITIEPGIYIPEENIGVRIEDDYWIIEDGVHCLSEQLPKSAKGIEALMKEKEEEVD